MGRDLAASLQEQVHLVVVEMVATIEAERNIELLHKEQHRPQVHTEMIQRKEQHKLRQMH